MFETKQFYLTLRFSLEKTVLNLCRLKTLLTMNTESISFLLQFYKAKYCGI